MDLKELRTPFAANDIEWRVGQCGLTKDGKVWATVLAYVTARAGQDRLDDVCGPLNWKVKYVQDGKGIMCELAISSIYTNANGSEIREWITKEDGAEQTAIEAYKGGISSAFKRASSAWGIGRYLYDLDIGFAKIEGVDRRTPGSKKAKTKCGKWFYWAPPQLPAWALPEKK